MRGPQADMGVKLRAQLVAELIHPCHSKRMHRAGEGNGGSLHMEPARTLVVAGGFLISHSSASWPNRLPVELGNVRQVIVDNSAGCFNEGMEIENR